MGKDPKPFPLDLGVLQVPKSSHCFVKEATMLNSNVLEVSCPGNGVISQDLKMTWLNYR